MTQKESSEAEDGCLELELPLAVLESCYKSEPGQVLYLNGKAERHGQNQSNNIKIKTERKKESICLTILASVISYTSDKWLAEKLVLAISSVENDCSSKDDVTTIDDHPLINDSTMQPSEMSGPHNEINRPKFQEDVDQWQNSDTCTGSDPDKVAKLVSDVSGSCVRDVNNRNKVCCRFCGKSFPTNPSRPLMALQQHETKFCKHNPWSMTTLEPKPVVSLKYPYSCQYCPHAFSSEGKCKKHEADCARRPDYMAKFDMKALMICDICNHMCANELGLAYHRTKTHGCPSSAKPRKRRKATPCACRFCGQMATSHSTRFHHEHFKCEKNPNVEQGVRCKFCAQMCTKDKLQAHIDKHHSKKEQHVCEVCGKVFDGKHKLYQHRLTHTEIQAPKHKCPHCDKVYLLKTRLKIHMSKHIEERTVQCTVCGKFFKNKHQENRHRNTVHENRYRFRCDKCGHGMAKKIYLDNHKCGRVRRAQDNDKKVNNKATKQDLDIVMVCPVMESEPQQVPINTAPTYDYYPEQTGFIPQRFEQQEQVISQNGIILEYFTS